MVEELDSLMESSAFYETKKGQAYHGDSRELLTELPESSIDLVVTSPPFALRRKKDYGNKNPEEYNDWFMDFAEEVERVLTDEGSFVVDIGGGWEKGKAIRSLYHFKLLVRLTDGEDSPFNLAQDFYWYNPAKLPTPAQWVTIEKIRATDAVNHVWWMSKSERPKADTKNVLQDYSDRQEQLMEEGYESFGVDKTDRPSGHQISDQFDTDNDGSLPDNLLEIANTHSNTQYLRACRATDEDPHPARFPPELPQFFIEFLTDPNDVVLDIFAGSNTVGQLAEKLGRHWLAFESDEEYLENSKLRFTPAEELERDDEQMALGDIDLD
jgi:site-specific DNA-methyltransferase (cytosine-N4-specific)